MTRQLEGVGTFRERFLFAALLLAAFLSAAVCGAQGQAAAPIYPVQADLVRPLDASRVKAGQPWLARVAQEWNGRGCHLKLGAIVEGHVARVVRRTKTDKTSSMHLVIDKASCDNRDPTEPKFTLVALLGPFGTPAPAGESGLSEGPPLADVPALAIGVPNGPAGEAPAMMRSVEAATQINQYALSARMTRKLPNRMLPGQVIDLPRMNLAVGTGVDGGSIIWATGTDARLEDRTTLILMPASPDTQTAGSTQTPQASSAGGEQKFATTTRPAGPTAQAIGVVDEADETEICSGSCNAVGSTALRDATTTAASASLRISQLGFAPHEKRLALSFDHETAITYLDEHHLLCTFDPHGLRVRSKDDADATHTIRAILIDPATHNITRVIDWRVRGNGVYLWRLGEGRVLVHLGHQLRLLDAELRPIRSISVNGPVTWVVSSPSRDHVAVAVMKKRYDSNASPTVEQLSVIDMNAKPDEDLDVRVYDGSLNPISASIRSARSQPPVLSDFGELRVSRVSAGRWKIGEYGWDKTERSLATVRTSCRPLASSPEHGLVFVTGCMASSGRTWYRMLREDGRPLLKAESPSDEIDQTATGSLSGSFAVRVLKATKPITVDDPYDRADLTKEEIAIYRSSDGAKVASVVTDDFILAQDSYALSPTGDQMAVVGKDSILFYALKVRPQTAPIG